MTHTTQTPEKPGRFIVDLGHPHVQIVLTDSIGEKYRTSAFAREKEAMIAINGEAGISPLSFTGLGEWTGNFVVEGRPVLLEDSPLRPFLSFDERNTGRYYPEELVVTDLTSDMHNTIWGRFDVLIDGQVPDVGDTMWVEINCGFGASIEEKLRLRGIDTPEISTDEGVVARLFVAERLQVGATIALTTSRSDLYDRYVAHVFYLPQGAQGDGLTALAKGRYLNRELVEEGVAHAIG